MKTQIFYLTITISLLLTLPLPAQDNDTVSVTKRSVPTPAQLSQPRDTVDSFINTYIAEHRVPGVAVAIIEDGRLMKARGYGLANVEHSVPVTAETIFQSGSLGKQFTATAVLLLAEDGLLSLDDPITRHLEEAPASWGAVTVRHLLNHTGGLAAYDDIVDWRRDYTEEELIRSIEDQPLLFEPGTELSYSNSGYMILGALISRITGAHWSEFMRDRVFLPAGMETARMISEAEIVPHRASGYRLEEGRLLNQEWVSPAMLSTGDGALYFSILDLVKWDQALRSDAILSDDSRRAMWKTTRLSDGAEVGYGFGWDVVGPPAVPHVGHGGGLQGFRTFIIRYVDPLITVAVLANGAQTNPHALAYGIAVAYNAELATILPDHQPLAPEMVSGFTGTYVMSDGDSVRLEMKDEELLLHLPWGNPTSLRFLGDDLFLLAEPSQYWYSHLLHFSRRNGEVVEAWLGQPGAYQDRLRRVR